jgi:hypothetical protein
MREFTHYLRELNKVADRDLNVVELGRRGWRGKISENGRLGGGGTIHRGGVDEWG